MSASAADGGARQDAPEQRGAVPGAPRPTGGVHNTVSGGVFYGPVIQGGQVTLTAPQQPAGAPSRGLPPPSSVHIGHEAELASLVAALDPGGRPPGPAACLVTGPGGAAPEMTSRSAALSWLSAELDNVVGICRAAAGSSAPERSWLLADALRGYFFLAKAWTPWENTHRVALAAAERAGARREQGILHNSLGLALVEQRHLAGASAHYTAAAHHFEAAGDAHGGANAVENHAWVRHYSGDYAGALEDHLQALRRYELLGAERNRAITLRGVSLAERELGRITDAIGHLREAGRIFDALDLHLDAAMTLNGLGEAYAKAGDPSSARLHLLRALRLSRFCGSSYEEARARRAPGSVSRADAPRRALHHWERALHHYTELGSPEAETVRALIAEVRAEHR
ncbi:tetratricopeptide repeat protein [Streptomyces sp. NPDC059008]|uniref:tetratricopeptide repeat protein n=1 Tax=Streptomyces sp. NPDC059008 TaxID=3346693 RepID=UPI003695A8D7